MRRLLSILAVAALAGAATQAQAVASGTATVSGDALVYTGDASTEHVKVDKTPVTDPHGNTVGAILLVNDTIAGGVAKGTSPCGRHENSDAFCPFGSSTLKVTLGGGNDTFASTDEPTDESPGKPEGCLALQSFAALELDAGPGIDLIAGTRLADTIAGGPGDDYISSWDGDDRVAGGAGDDLIETHDGNDVADGGSGRDVIHLDETGRSTGDSCFRASGRHEHDVGRGGPGNDAVTTSGGGDRLEGGAGNDTLGGGNPKQRGRDRIFGGPGRDRIYARDGVRDYINCGPGKDVVSYADRSDRAVGCEKRIVSKKEYLASALDSADDGSSTNDITRKVTVTFGLRR